MSSKLSRFCMSVFWWITFLEEFTTIQMKRRDARHSPYPRPTQSVSETSLNLTGFLREKPNATTITLESLILFNNNKTREWLLQKSDDQKAKIFSSARKMAPKLRKLYQKREISDSELN